MSKGGGGATGETQYNWNDVMAQKWPSVLQWGEALTDPSGYGAYDQYQGQRIAPFHAAQVEGLDRINSLANNGGTVLSKAGDDETYRTLAGDYLPGGISGNPYADQGNIFSSTRNPFGTQTNPNASLSNGYQSLENAYAGLQNPYGEKSNPYADINNPQAANPFTFANTSTARNQYSGTDSPYFRDTLQNALGDITNSYQQGTASDTNRMFAMGGAFGGSAHQQSVANNEAALAKQLSNTASGMFNDQYNRSAGLEESYLGRDVANQQYNRSTGSNLYENQLGRAYGGMESQLGRGNADIEAWINRMYGSNESMVNRGNADTEAQLNRMYGSGESQLDRGNTDFEAMINRLYGGQESQLNRGNADYEAERQRQMQAIPYGQNNLNQALQLYNAQVGVGDAYRGWNQDQLNVNYNDWLDQNNQQYKMLDYLTGLYSRSQGGMSPNSTTTQSGYTANPLSSILGGALASYGMFR